MKAIELFAKVDRRVRGDDADLRRGVAQGLRRAHRPAGDARTRRLWISRRERPLHEGDPRAKPRLNEARGDTGGEEILTQRRKDAESQKDEDQKSSSPLLRAFLRLRVSAPLR